MLVNKRKEFIINAAMALDRAQMLRYNERTGDLSSTGSLFNINYFISMFLYLNYNYFIFQIWAAQLVIFILVMTVLKYLIKV